MDYCPKAIALPRGDSAICFAGETQFAYPMMIQASLAIEAYGKSLSRAMDLHHLKGYLINVLTEMALLTRSHLADEKIPKVTFILAGYSWETKSFHIWRINYQEFERRFVATHAKEFVGHLGQVAFAGDVQMAAWSRFYKLMRERFGVKHNKPGTAIGLDMEPFEVVRDLLREAPPYGSIGGAPQMIQIYQHMNARPIGVYWPDRRGGRIHLMGRPILEYETIDHWSMDPDTFDRYHFSYPTRKRDSEET